MRKKSLFVFSLLLFVGCANYRLLKPDPELSPEEKGYIQLKDGKRDFEIKKDKKYFITFPPPAEDNFYLVLSASAKKSFNSFLTSELIKKKKYGEKIKDESHAPDTLSVYPVGKKAAAYYWLIDGIKENVVLTLDYRYVPQWRFKFENKHDEYKKTLEKNRVDRSNYNNLGTEFHFKGFDFKTAMDSIAGHSKSLKTVLDQLLAIESIFPAGIVNSTDKAYLDYKKLKKDLEDEIKFQADYLTVLDFFNRMEKTTGDVAAFLGMVDNFITYFSEKMRFPENVLAESRKVLEGRLAEIVPFYRKLLGGKADASPFDPAFFHMKGFKGLDKLYENSGIAPSAEYTLLSKFMKSFNGGAKAVAAAKDTLEAVAAHIKKLADMPDNEFFKGVVSRVAAAQKTLPKPLDNAVGEYLGYTCAKALNVEIAKTVDLVGKKLNGYEEAQRLVPELNTLKARSDYRGMLGLLKQYTQLDFLLDKYAKLDRLSVEQQSSEIKSALAEYHWAQAEGGLKQLHADRNFLDLAAISPVRETAVRDLEDSLYTTIDRVTRYRVNKFLVENVDTLENIDSLYTDSVFLPAYDVTFSSGSKKDLIRRKNDLIAHLAKMKENEFPAKAITLLYEQFIKNINDKGVLKTRAIVAHGTHYKGEDKKIKGMMAECNPWSSKWIVKPKEYRRVFVVPITDNARGSNRYFFRLNIKIPTDAKFPVYDVNIKLPAEIAKSAGEEQWYEKITMNKNVLKNEGRFSITAPTAENEYECQITPVQMKKDENNFLDVYFNHNSFKVLTVSVMVQKPIIKKN